MTKKILVVDDQSEIRRIIKMILGSRYEILEAEEGSSALRLFHEQQPDLVLLDVMMPGDMDGFQLLKHIKEYPSSKQTPVIMLTACGQQQDYEKGKTYGADNYFIKPFSPVRLANAIEELIG